MATTDITYSNLIYILNNWDGNWTTPINKWEENSLVRWANGLTKWNTGDKEDIPKWMTKQNSDDKVDMAEWDKLIQPIKE